MIDSQDVEQNAPESFQSKRLITSLVLICFTLVAIGSQLALSEARIFDQIMVIHGDDNEIPELDATTSKPTTETDSTFPEPTSAQPESNEKPSLTQKSTKHDDTIEFHKMYSFIMISYCMKALSKTCPLSNQMKAAIETQIDEIRSVMNEVHSPFRRLDFEVEHWHHKYDATVNMIANSSEKWCDSKESECQLCIDCTVQFRFKNLRKDWSNIIKYSPRESMDPMTCRNYI